MLVTVPVCQLSEVETEKLCVVIGSIARRIVLRPSVLRALADDGEVTKMPVPLYEERLVSKDDILEFEDEKQIVRLEGKQLDQVPLATGVVVALLGAQVSNDLFRVDKVFFPQLPSPSTLLSSKENRSIMFISGLDFTGYEVNDGRTIKCLHLMSKWLSGLLAQSEEERTLIASIARLVIAGGSIHVDETDQSKDRPGCADMSKIISARNFLTRREQRANDLCLKNMDFILSKFTPFVPVDVMPGVGDPTTSLIPQQPIHICCFPRASRYGRMLNMVTNPYEFSLGGQRVLGSSGQNVNDLIKLSSNGTALDRLADIIRWQHLGPTIPDTIDGFPFRDRDPLVLNEVPRVLFAGCQKRAGHRLLKTETGIECMLLAVPCFARRPIAVILNLATMQVTYQDFATC